MTSTAHLLVEHELIALRAEIRLAAERLRRATRPLKPPPPPRPSLRLVRGGLWRPLR